MSNRTRFMTRVVFGLLLAFLLVGASSISASAYSRSENSRYGTTTHLIPNQGGCTTVIHFVTNSTSASGWSNTTCTEVAHNISAIDKRLDYCTNYFLGCWNWKTVQTVGESCSASYTTVLNCPTSGSPFTFTNLKSKSFYRYALVQCTTWLDGSQGCVSGYNQQWTS